jgi:threonine/homoserine/homoserine lactone efflux protein
MDWIRKVFSDPSTFFLAVTSGILGLIVGIANGVVQKRHGGWPAFFGAMATASVVAIIVGLGLSEYVKSEALRLAIIGVCAVISDDIWAGLRTFGASVRTDPIGSFWRVVDALRGRAASPHAAPKED